tara:strand:+ start:84 stop:1124 length:1041 start_codon:yes stop_codon:yes gene_type:complete
MKKYTFTGKNIKKNVYEKYYTTEEFINKNIINIFKNLKENNKDFENIHFIDTSAGDNRLVKILIENKLIESYKSFDISFSKISFGEIELKNWIGENYCTLKKYDKKNTLIGFNPPYGYNNKKAKVFIKKSWEEFHKYCIWLVPNSVKPYLLERYEELHSSCYTNITFIDKNFDNNKKIKQSVMLFIGQRRSKILSKIKKQKSIPKHNFTIERKHYKGIDDNVSLIIKKTGNPVLFPLFYKKGDYWTQYYYKGEKVTDKAKIIEKDGKKYMRGISKNKNGIKVFDYAIESNVYFRISNIENITDMEMLVEKLVELGKSNDFFKFTNKYKPASITQGWFIDYLNNLLN